MEAFGVVVRVRPDRRPPGRDGHLRGAGRLPRAQRGRRGPRPERPGQRRLAPRPAPLPPQARPAGARVSGRLPGRLRPRPAWPPVATTSWPTAGGGWWTSSSRRTATPCWSRKGASWCTPTTSAATASGPRSGCWGASPIPPPAPRAWAPFSARGGGDHPAHGAAGPARPRGGRDGHLPPRAGAADADHRLHHRRAGAGAPARRPGQSLPARLRHLQRGLGPEPGASRRAGAAPSRQRYRASLGPQGARATVA